ncbi:hypothetical protein PR001_g25252 [Phytophthora rubi]|uniref:Uncharacterized protein n=1 Tax=Phytophthora rubi TaxID=129364 RepID=A0A6A3I2I2_9STRA|nr:hypothetical protein PR001_g25252 [Phytophthora rubi]
MAKPVRLVLSRSGLALANAVERVGQRSWQRGGKYLRIVVMSDGACTSVRRSGEGPSSSGEVRLGSTSRAATGGACRFRLVRRLDLAVLLSLAASSCWWWWRRRHSQQDESSGVVLVGDSSLSTASSSGIVASVFGWRTAALL